MIYKTYSVGGELYHARSHKYINKFRGKNGKWRYIYKIAKSAVLNGKKFVDADQRLNDSAYNWISNKQLLNYYNDSLGMQKRWTNALKDHINTYNKIHGNKKSMLYSKDLYDTTEKEKRYDSMIKQTRNEIKLNKRENDRARRDAATNAGVDDYRLATKAVQEKGKKLVDKILGMASRSAKRESKKKKKR